VQEQQRRRTRSSTAQQANLRAADADHFFDRCHLIDSALMPRKITAEKQRIISEKTAAKQRGYQRQSAGQ
jgi:hypothetical protein